ncbi:uncharacterized protein [Centruroides vittatus]|uniref:uncharacterized protein isoform X1 n=1 Tax=Centruroides vittatus TaxID=120091 RepID=UPI0035100D7D
MVFNELVTKTKNEQRCIKVEDFNDLFYPNGNIKSEVVTVILPCDGNGKNYQKSLDQKQNSWPDILKIRYHDIYYNINSSCEELEASIINLVKFDTISSFCETRLTPAESQKRIEKSNNMVRNRQKKRDICELLFTSPERHKMLNQNNQQTKKFKNVRSDLMPTTEIRQISVISRKQDRKKTVKACFKTDFTLKFENLACDSTNINFAEVPKGCRKQLFVNHSITNGHKGKSNSGNNSVTTLNQNKPLGWSIKKNRPSAIIKPILSLDANKCISSNEEIKKKLPLRKDIHRIKITNTNDYTNSICNESSQKNFKYHEEKRSSSFNSENSEDLLKDRESELSFDELSERHKKKLREAVVNALEKYDITLDHPMFKIYGRNLFALCKVHLKDVIGKGRTSVQMKLLAENHVEEVLPQEIKMKLKL